MATGKIFIYEHSDFKGVSRELTADVSDLQTVGFNDRTSSIKVYGSVWVGYQFKEYGGKQFILEEGEFPNARSWHGIPNQISSLKRLKMDHLGETPTIELYSKDNYEGSVVSFEHGITKLKYYGFDNDASSLKVKSGTWICYQFPEYKGRQFIVTEGSYPTWKSWKARVDNQISSLRPVHEPAIETEVVSMEFDIDSGLLTSTHVALVNVSQTNDTSSDQEAKWSTTRTVTTTKTHEWHWNNSQEIGVAAKLTIGVPDIIGGEISMSAKNTFFIGENSGSKNTQSDEWKIELPGTVKEEHTLRIQVTIQQGKIDVPFTAVMKRGTKRWEERGTYMGIQSYNLHIDYKETPV